ncbi:amino acid ABC transporter permease [Taklimakanibacter albus]|uniref:Amino acid ABC transporter permease n=1 Tax=Taklimakanibacter albus TaxID=2800327 RepID=A0ACC5R719_9HYPH|nr:amino acid ABC transporter permease [Aestuariivirga sp. YIM B02566]MBK1868471.1 amino acid ABC transporter permease [Aestuariivirga sp. YIM B02566]
MIDLIVKYAPSLFQGILTTVFVSGAAILLGAVPALGLAFGLISKNRILRTFCALYRSFWRGTPILVQLLIVFYLLPLIGINVPPVLAAILALALNTTAFQAEIYRAGLNAIPAGQIEAARMLGIGTAAIRRRILVPQTIRLVLPALVSEIVIIIKNSSLVSVIAVTEVTRVSQQMASNSFRPLESYVAAGIIYLIICFLVALLGLVFERLLSRRGGVSS